MVQETDAFGQPLFSSKSLNINNETTEKKKSKIERDAFGQPIFNAGSFIFNKS